jgi:hypothetical protein
MLRRISLAALVCAVATMAPARAAGPRPAEGRIESEEGRVEILGRPLHSGDRIDLPEGFLRVEEDAPDDGEVGSFAVVSAEAFTGTSPAPRSEPVSAGEPAGADVAALAAAGGPGCRAERAAYLSELWRASGIDVKDPAALLEGLDAGASGPLTGYYWFALATDAFRPLAWSSELRSRADALARCARASSGH